MKILYLAHRIPYPPNKGDKIRSFNEIKYLSGFGEVYLGALVDNPCDMKYEQGLNCWCREIYLIPLSTMKKKLLSLKGLWNGTPMSVHYFYEQDLQQAVDHLISIHNFDVIFCFSSPMAEYLFRSSYCRLKKRDNSNSSIFIMDFCDVDSQKWKEYSKICKWPLSKIFLKESDLLCKYEHKVAKTFDYSIFVSEREKKLFKQLNPDIDPILTVGNGVDIEYFQPGRPSKKGNKSIPSHPSVLFTGVMDYYANVDGVCWFVKEIWPNIKREVPETVFYIVGSNPSPEIKQLHNNIDIIVTGYVDDVRFYYDLATLCIVPLRVARGIQNKVLEAMAMAKPVVCTPNAFEGIDALPGQDLIIAFKSRDFAKAVTKLLQDKTLRDELGSRARKCMETCYNWNVQLNPLKQILSKKDIQSSV